MSCRVLIAGSSPRLATWARALFEQPGLIAAAPPCDLRSIFANARSSNPDVVVVEFAGGEEPFHAVSQLMADWPTPILALHSKEDLSEVPSRALSLGALDLVEVPEAPTSAFWNDLVKRLKLLSRVRVVRHLGTPDRRAIGPGHVPSAEVSKPPFPLVAIAASLGGPKALHALLCALPASFPAAVCICQHITEGFSSSLAHWLTSETGRVVEEAADDQPMVPGEILIAPTGFHLRVSPEGRTQLDLRAPQMGFRPSCDILLTSVAEAFRERACGVILTGMGRDGAEGLLAIRRCGGFTVAQDQATSIVFGMPAAAIELGAADQVLPLDKIAVALTERLARS